ncbi:MAG: putative glycoside hydrolase [Patescibacteria group bacterium]
MKLYSFTIIFLLIFIIAGGAFIVGNFEFIRKIPAMFLNTFDSDKEIVKTNKRLSANPVKGIYSTIWTARSKRIDDLIKIADETEINAIIIDVKDSDVYIDDYVKNLVIELHKKNIYAIARVVVFADNSQINIHPDWYFKKSDGSLWVDNRGWYWMDPTNHEVWSYNVAAAKEAIGAGFDELNFDYIRYPSFKKDDDVVFTPVLKSQTINDFVHYLNSELKKYDQGITLSVDLFAYNMLNGSDLGVGQKFTDLYDYFDYVSPMIYPSHYISGNFGFDNPADYPYEVVLMTIEKGKKQLWEKSIAEIGTSTPVIVNPIFEKRLKKLRPWLQDFNIGAVYDSEMIRKEIQAVYDSGLTSGWLLWNPRNVYTEEALDKISN